MSDEQATAILERRARALARPLERSGAGSGESLVTLVRGARYAVPLAAIREIRPFVSPNPLPGAPPFVVGLVNSRGGVVPAVDLGSFFGAPAVGDPVVLIFVADAAFEIALLAETIDAVADVPMTSLGRLPAGTSALTREYGIRLARGAGVVLDAAQLLRGIASSLRPSDQDGRGRGPTTPADGGHA